MKDTIYSGIALNILITDSKPRKCLFKNKLSNFNLFGILQGLILELHLVDFDFDNSNCRLSINLLPMIVHSIDLYNSNSKMNI